MGNRMVTWLMTSRDPKGQGRIGTGARVRSTFLLVFSFVAGLLKFMAAFRLSRKIVADKENLDVKVAKMSPEFTLLAMYKILVSYS